MGKIKARADHRPSPKLNRNFMTWLAGGGYYLSVMNDWKYKWAFVIQFQPETDLETGHCKGRVEHIISHKSVRFNSLEELLAFVSRVLAETRANEEQDYE
ncbi:MAG TPA: hypothetical protein VJ810_05160 [Blastocatellia bacterium]|nr:hypothetical protein [Blastocatellia bacterium]